MWIAPQPVARRADACRTPWTSAAPWMALVLLAGCSRQPGASEAKGTVTPESAARQAGIPVEPPRIVSWGAVEEFDQPLAIMETVFWEPDDTLSLRKLIRETELARNQRILEIGTGSGLVALCCLRAGAQHVVATDINPTAVVCAGHNAVKLGLDQRLELRQVSQAEPEAFAVIGPEERFNLIISNPPWEDQPPKSIAEFALYDRNFALMKSLVAGLDQHLLPEGRALLAYGCRTAIVRLQALADEHGYDSRILDDRELASLPEVFLPGMLVELRRRQKP